MLPIVNLPVGQTVSETSANTTGYGNFDDQMSWDNYLDLVDNQNMFNSAEAEKTRDWSQMMRDTQVSSYMNQLKDAGINPILAVNSGYSGASYQTSATGQAYSGTSPYSNSSRVEAALIRALGSVVSAVTSSAIKVAGMK